MKRQLTNMTNPVTVTPARAKARIPEVFGNTTYDRRPLEVSPS